VVYIRKHLCTGEYSRLQVFTITNIINTNQCQQESCHLE